MGKSKNILIVTLHYLNGVGGGVFASRAYINTFAELFCRDGNVTLLYPSSPANPIEGIDHRVNAIPVYDNSSKITRLLNLLRGRVHRNFDAFKELITINKYDIVVFDNSRVSYQLIDLAHESGAKVITIHHNCELEYNRDNSSRYLRRVLLYWTKKYEHQALQKSDLNLTLTPEDKELFAIIYPGYDKDRTFVLGTFESDKSEDVAADIATKPNNACKHFVITGNLSARQTIDSLQPWLDIYYPVLKEIFPESRLTIAGKNPPESLVAKCRKLNITLIPSPPDMTPILKSADCYICPTAFGGGLKLRIMDGLKMGLPVITHTVSARGYNEFIKLGIMFSYDDTESFVKACESYRYSTLCKAEIKQLYQNIFSFESGVNRLRCILGSQLIK